MSLIKTTTVDLLVKTQTGTDALNNPVYDTEWEEVDGVLFGEPSTDDVATTMSLYGKTINAMLALPKGDAHEWEDTLVRYNNHIFKTIGTPIEGIEENVPLQWHKKVRLMRYVDYDN